MTAPVAHSVSQPVFDVRLLYDLKMPMRDGVRLSADVFLPRASGPFPTILSRTPYESNSEYHVAWGVWWAQRGYAAVLQDLRGRYESEGGFYAYQSEAQDGEDSVEWLQGQTWCNGQIGMWGRSYGALVQWKAAPLLGSRVTCLAPHVIPDDYFHDYHYVGGAFQFALPLAAMAIWETNVAILKRSSAHLFNNWDFYSRLPVIDLDVELLGRKVQYWRDWIEHDTNDTYWARQSTLDKSGIDVPIFQQSGWFDPYVRPTFRSWNAMTGPDKSSRTREGQKVLIGPWTHEEPTGSRMGDVDFGAHAFRFIWDEDLRWFDHWLKGIDTGYLSEPPIRLFVMGTNEWRFEKEWPLARARATPFYLHSGGRANSLHGNGRLSLEAPADEPPDRFEYDPDNPVPTVGGVHSIQEMTEFAERQILAGPVDQRVVERRDDVLVYTSRALEHDLEIAGPLEVVLYAATSARDTDFTVKVADVFPDGRSMNLTEGIIRAKLRHSDQKPDFLQPGEVDEYRIQLYPTCNVFRAGHRIRLDVSSSNFPRFSRSLNTGENAALGTTHVIARQTILHSSRYPSHLVLPVIP